MQVCRSQASVFALHLLRAVLSRPSRALLLGTHVDQPFVVRPSFLSRRTLSVQLGDDVGVEAAAGADAYAQRLAIRRGSGERGPQGARRSKRRGRLARAPGSARERLASSPGVTLGSWWRRWALPFSAARLTTALSARRRQPRVAARNDGVELFWQRVAAGAARDHSGQRHTAGLACCRHRGVWWPERYWRAMPEIPARL
jgi:hypothetical protein